MTVKDKTPKLEHCVKYNELNQQNPQTRWCERLWLPQSEVGGEGAEAMHRFDGAAAGRTRIISSRELCEHFSLWINLSKWAFRLMERGGAILKNDEKEIAKI